MHDALNHPPSGWVNLDHTHQRSHEGRVAHREPATVGTSAGYFKIAREQFGKTASLLVARDSQGSQAAAVLPDRESADILPKCVMSHMMADTQSHGDRGLNTWRGLPPYFFRRAYRRHWDPPVQRFYKLVGSCRPLAITASPRSGIALGCTVARE